MKRITASALMLTAALTLSGCANDPGGNAPKQPDVNNGPVQIIDMPNHFASIASKCDGPNRIYETYTNGNYAGLSVIPNDPRCSEK